MRGTAIVRSMNLNSFNNNLFSKSFFQSGKGNSSLLAGLLFVFIFPFLNLHANDLSAEDSSSLYRVLFEKNGIQPVQVEGKLLLKAADGGLLLQQKDGNYLNITPDKIVEQEKTSEFYQPYSLEQLKEVLIKEMGDQFETIHTNHYVIVTDAGKKYARWCGALLERLLKAHTRYWKKSEGELQKPVLPLIAVVFSNRNQFVEYARKDVGIPMEGAYGYYSMKSNRIIMYDLTESSRKRRSRSLKDINRLVQRKPANIATVVHEATHQIAFNINLQTRYADTPLWLSEGFAMYAETPDLKSRSGWKSIGRINRDRLSQFRKYYPKRKWDSLKNLIISDERMTNAENAQQAYSEAWALTWFLVKTRKTQFLKYMHTISQKTPLVYDSPEKRLEDFEQAFEMKWDELDQLFIKYLRRISRKYQ